MSLHADFDDSQYNSLAAAINALTDTTRQQVKASRQDAELIRGLSDAGASLAATVGELADHVARLERDLAGVRAYTQDLAHDNSVVTQRVNKAMEQIVALEEHCAPWADRIVPDSPGSDQGTMLH